jgi:hypothetical protein
MYITVSYNDCIGTIFLCATFLKEIIFHHFSSSSGWNWRAVLGPWHNAKGGQWNPLARATTSILYCSQCVVHIAVGLCAKGHFIHTGINGPGVPLTLVIWDIVTTHDNETSNANQREQHFCKDNTNDHSWASRRVWRYDPQYRRYMVAFIQCKVRAPILSVYGVFYTMYYWMILIAIL